MLINLSWIWKITLLDFNPEWTHNKKQFFSKFSKDFDKQDKFILQINKSILSLIMKMFTIF